MVDFIEPIVRNSDMGPLEAMNLAHAQAYGRLDSKLSRHIEDNIVHITNEEREAWNNKVNREELEEIKDDIRDIITEGSTKTKLSQFENDPGFITNSELSERLRLYVDWTSIRDIVDQLLPDMSIYLTTADLDGYATINVLADYATRAWADSNFATQTLVRDLQRNLLFGYASNIDANTPNSYLIGIVRLYGTNYNIYGVDTNDGSGGEGGGADYQEEIDRMNDIIDGIQDTLDHLHDYSEEQIKAMVNDLLAKYEVLYGDGKINTLWHYSQWVDAVLSYVSEVGYIAQTEEGLVTMNVSQIIQSLTSISATVSELSRIIDPEGHIDIEALEASLKLYIDDKTSEAIATISSKWALQSENEADMQWAISSLKTVAGPGGSFVDVWTEFHTDTTDAISALSAWAGGSITYASLTSRVSGIVSDVVDDAVDEKIVSASLITYADLNEAIAGMVVESDLNGYAKRAEIIAYINDDVSGVTINADKININGQLIAQKIQAQDLTLNGTVTASKIRITQDDGYGMFIGNKTYNNKKYAYIDIDNNSIGDYDTDKHVLNLCDPAYNDPDSYIIYPDQNHYCWEYLPEGAPLNYIAPDGSGYLAGGAIAWRADGSGHIGGLRWDTTGTITNIQFDQDIERKYDNKFYWDGHDYVPVQ